MPERRIALDGAINFRDLGGYPAGAGRRTRWRRIFRSDSLADLTEGDQTTLTELGVRTVCDFRLPQEVERKPNRLPTDTKIRSVGLGFIPEGTLDMLIAINSGDYSAADIEREVLHHYPRFVTDHGSIYRAMFDLILEDDGLPLVIHCTSGKDRTGFGAAAVLLAAGVAPELVVEDYALTNHYRRDISHMLSDAVAPGAVETLTSANPDYIRAALDAMTARHGSVAGWFASIGLGAAEQERLREVLTENDQAN